MKTLSTYQQALTLLPIITVMIIITYSYQLATNTANHPDVELPKIHGVILKEAQQLTNVHLSDHQGKTVSSDYFKGNWHFITYGYTQCPDICPTTLITLVQLANLLSTNNDNLETQFIFYSIDPARDSQQVIAQYIQYFSKDFVAMRANNSSDANDFQQSLGIKVDIQSSSMVAADAPPRTQLAKKELLSEVFYQVSHGLTIFLINPKAELQAVFLPDITELGINSFTSEMLYRDYLKVVKYYRQVN